MNRVMENAHATAPVPPDELLRRFDRPGPRYTSYPTADRFTEDTGPLEYSRALLRRSRKSSQLDLGVVRGFW